MKKLSVVVAGTGQIRDVEIQPGTTAGDVLTQLGLKDYLLSKGPNDPFFAAAKSIYDKVNGLFAVSGELTREIKFACHQIDDAGEVAERRYSRALAFAAVPDC